MPLSAQEGIKLYKGLFEGISVKAVEFTIIKMKNL